MNHSNKPGSNVPPFRHDTIAEAVRAAADRVGVPHAVSTALYPCAGIDLLAVARTRPEHYAALDVKGAPSPDVFLYVDTADPIEGGNRFGFEDDFCRIGHAGLLSGALGGHPCHEVHLNVESGARGGEEKAGFTVVLLCVTASHQEFADVVDSEGFLPDMFIGVTDGCILGGNKSCVNQLVLRQEHQKTYKDRCMPGWYVTDHFRNCLPMKNPVPGTVVRSTEPAFPHAFELVARLDSGWGEYSRHSPLKGATLFRCVPAGATAPGSGIR
ncbi:MAG: hypothetical protein ACLFOY_18995 [Desulfatibacillaceae bacterium]